MYRTEANAESPSVLVVDDDAAVARILQRGLNWAGYLVETANSPAEGLERLAQRSFDLLLTDYHMPGMSGDEFQRLARERDPELIVLLITAADDTRTAVACMRDGVYDYILKPFDIQDVTMRIARAWERRCILRENAAHQESLREKLEAQAEQLRKLVQGSMSSLVFALEARDPYTHNHSFRVARLAETLARHLYPGDAWLAERIQTAAILHDIGKIGVPDAILQKPGRLEGWEMEQVQQHPVIGANILAPLFEQDIIAMVRHHHESMNGKGYPDKLAGEEIPLGARIIAVADAYDAMTSVRPYRREMVHQDALCILREGAGMQWDNRIVAGFLEVTTTQDFHLDEGLAAVPYPVLALVK